MFIYRNGDKYDHDDHDHDHDDHDHADHDDDADEAKVFRLGLCCVCFISIIIIKYFRFSIQFDIGPTAE